MAILRAHLPGSKKGLATCGMGSNSAFPRMKIFSGHFPSLRPHETCMDFPPPRVRLALAVFFAFFLGGAGPEVFGQSPVINWERVARIKPNLRVVVLIQGNRALNLEDLAFLESSGLCPADREAALILGGKKAIFKTPLRRWMERPPWPIHLQASLLPRFRMSGIYQVGFEIEEKEYRGPLYFEVTAPRGGFGQKLLYSEHLVRPFGESAIRVDSAGNRWLCVNYPQIRSSQKISFQFGFHYRVDMGELLAHDLSLAGEPAKEDLPPNVKTFLKGGYKIDPKLPEAVSWAKGEGPGPPDARRDYAHLSKFLKQFVAYDKNKRRAYFGGHSVYWALDEMYKDLAVTLNKRLGCCPDTVLLECSFLRARGIPCRTAGRFGHFFSEVYLPGQGWMSTSVIATGIPLIVSGGPDYVPYQKWIPRIPLRTTHWQAAVRITAPEDEE